MIKIDQLCDAYALKQDASCFDGLTLAEDLIGEALKLVAFYTRGESDKTRALMGVLTVLAIDKAKHDDSPVGFDAYTMPLTREGRRLPLKQLIEQVERHYQSTQPHVQELFEEGRRLGLTVDLDKGKRRA